MSRPAARVATLIALVLASTEAVTLPFLIAGQVSSQGVKWWTMAAGCRWTFTRKKASLASS